MAWDGTRLELEQASVARLLGLLHFWFNRCKVRTHLTSALTTRTTNTEILDLLVKVSFHIALECQGWVSTGSVELWRDVRQLRRRRA
jgi:hypothetical protein